MRFSVLADTFCQEHRIYQFNLNLIIHDSLFRLN